MELTRILRNLLSPVTPTSGSKLASLHTLCIRTAAIYATTSLYEFHDKQKNLHLAAVAAAAAAADHPGGGGGGGGLGGHGGHGGGAGQAAAVVLAAADSMVQESMWEEVFPLLDQHFLQLVPGHLYEQFLDNVLCALEIAHHYDATGKQLTQYIILFFPRHMRRYRAQKYIDKVMMPTICCLHKCTNIEELYLEKAESPGITTYLLAHILKFTNGVKVLSLPKQCDDDVASIVGINCKKLESVILTGTNITNIGLSWLLCCRNLHTVIMPGFFVGITPKGVALILNGLPGLRHVVYDVMSDVLTYVDFNTSLSVLPQFGLKTVLFHSMELLSSNHLELVTKLCPSVEWLSLDSALFYNLEGLGRLPHLVLLRLNYKSRPIDQTVVDFFNLNAQNLTTLHLFDVKDLSLDDMQLTLGQCKNLEILVLCDCSLLPDWNHLRLFYKLSATTTTARRPSLSHSVRHLQLLSFQLPAGHLVDFIALFKGLRVLEMDRCDLDLDRMKMVLIDQPELHTLRCTQWTHTSAQNLASLQMSFRNCKLQLNKQAFAFDEDLTQTMAATLLSDYAGFASLLNFDSLSS